MSILENISHPLISATSWGIFHSLWQFALIMGLYFLAMRLTAKSDAAIRHHIALLALIALPVTFFITFLKQYFIYSKAKMIVSLEFEYLTKAVSQDGPGVYLVNKNIPEFLNHFESWIPYVFWLYAAGLVLFSVYGISGFARINSMRKNHISPLPENWRKKILTLYDKAGVSGITAYISARVDIPLVAGMIKPVILLPVGMLTSLDPGQVEAIILHELRHIRNKDHYINMLQSLVEIIFFYHPATWYISTQLRSEREKRVDEWVVKTTQTPYNYAQALLQLENSRSHALQPALAATQSKNQLLTRIKNIMTMKTRPFNPGKNVAALVTIVLAVFTLAWFDPAHGIGYYNMDEPGQHVFLDHPQLSPSFAMAEAATTNTANTPAESAGEPKKVYFHDGSSMNWEALSEEEKKVVAKALEEARIAISEANAEILEKFHSEEFRQQMQQAQEEVKRAMAEAKMEINMHLHSEEFRREMEQAKEEVRKAMEEVNRQVFDKLHSEEFQQEMQATRREIQEALKELDQIDWSAIGKEIDKTMGELGRSLEEIGPMVNETIRELKLDELMKEILEALEKAGEPDSVIKP